MINYLTRTAFSLLSGGGGGGGGSGGGGGGWGNAFYSGAKTALGCAKSTIGKKWKRGLKCATGLVGVGTSLFDAVKTNPSAQDVVDGVGGSWGASFGALMDCAGAGLDFAIGNYIAAYKCARGVLKTLAEACRAAGGGGGGSECSPDQNTPICDKVKEVDDFFNYGDTLLNLLTLSTGGLLRRHLAGLPSSLTPEEEKAIMTELFFESEEQYDRFSFDFIGELVNNITNARENGLTDEKIFELYDLLRSDVAVLRNISETFILLEDVIEELPAALVALQDTITDVAATVEKEAAAAAEITLPKRKLFIYIETEDGDQFRIQTTEAGEIVGFVMAPEVAFAIVAYDAQNNVIGYGNGVTSPNGVRTTLPSITFTDASVFDDTDEDGLCDSCEFIIGTNAEKADSDSDGAGDLQEVLRGSNPLDGLVSLVLVCLILPKVQLRPYSPTIVLLLSIQALTTGIVGNFPLPRDAASPTAVEAMGSKIFVALSSGGIACYNVFDALQVG